MKILLGAIFIFSALAFAGPASAQLACPTPTSCTITVPMVPAQAILAWDLVADTPETKVTGYAVYDGTTRVLTVPVVASTPVPLNQFATHVLTVTALAGDVESDPSNSVAVIVAQLPSQAPKPAPPQNVRIAAAWPFCPTTSAFGTTGASVTDGNCHVFTLTGVQVLRDGGSTNGAGTVFTYVPTGVYVLGTDNVWYRFSIASDGTAAWTASGTTKPIA